VTAPEFHPPSSDARATPPGAWSTAQRAAQRVRAPVDRFLSIQASSGIVLLVVALFALLWANSPWRDSYAGLFHTHFGLSLGRLTFERDLHFWINDGLMTIFFFVVGLEIRREIHRGELSELRRAMLPLATALGGMLVPAVIFTALNAGRSSQGGWGVPMATDIAFAVGVLALLGSRVPPALRVLLLALAVIDDVGAILVIAFFYSGGLDAQGFAVTVLGLAGILTLQKVGVRSPWAYVPPAILAWAGSYAAGVHPTLSGVVIGLMTPAQAWFGREGFLKHTESNLEQLRTRETADEAALIPHLDALNAARREAISPVESLQHALHGWVAYGVMPLFALANAGVPLGNTDFTGDGYWAFLGVFLGLTLGKPIGIMALAWLSTRLGLTALPRGVTWAQVLLVGIVAGIGFTMSLFIAGLAFERGTLLETVKLSILCASAGAGILGFAFGRQVLPKRISPEAAKTTEEAEASTAA
jgi:Na+:H+ antiporter, NhaA family